MDEFILYPNENRKILQINCCDLSINWTFRITVHNCKVFQFSLHCVEKTSFLFSFRVTRRNRSASEISKNDEWEGKQSIRKILSLVATSCHREEDTTSTNDSRRKRRYRCSRTLRSCSRHLDSTHSYISIFILPSSLFLLPNPSSNAHTRKM